MTLGHHVGQHGLGDDEGCVEVDVDDAAEIGGFHFVHGDAADDAGIVHEDVDGAHLFLDLLDECLYGGFIGDVADVTVGLDALFLVGLQAAVHQLLVDVVETDGGTLLCKGTGDGEADAVAGTGDEGHFALEGEVQIGIHRDDGKCKI